MVTKKTAVIATALVMAFCVPAQALPAENERYTCIPLVRAAETSHGIPDGLLEAIMWTESGYADPDTGRRFPHPWMINDHGRDLVFDTKQEVVEAVERLLRHAHRVLDVGCMQRNLHFHPDREGASVSDLVQPEHNVQWAADYLVELYKGNGMSGGGGDYLRAAARFHRFVEDQEFIRYQNMLESNWAKVRQERGLPEPHFANRTIILASASPPTMASVNVLLPYTATSTARTPTRQAPASRVVVRYPPRRAAQLAEARDIHE